MNQDVQKLADEGLHTKNLPNPADLENELKEFFSKKYSVDFANNKKPISNSEPQNLAHQQSSNQQEINNNDATTPANTQQNAPKKNESSNNLPSTQLSKKDSINSQQKMSVEETLSQQQQTTTPSSNKNIHDLVSKEKMEEEDQQLASNQEKLQEKVGSVAINAVNNPKTFKPKKIPIFLGIFCKGSDIKDTVYTVARQVLMKIQGQASQNSPVGELAMIKNDLEEIATHNLAQWKFPNSFHVTSFFVGKEAQRTSSEFFSMFKEKVHFPFEISHVIYVPGKLLTGIPKLN